MTAERGPQGNMEEFPNLGVVDLSVSGLHAEDAIGRSGQVEIKSNLSDPSIQSKIESILSQPRYEKLVAEVKSGQKLAFASFKKHMTISLVVISAGTVVAAAAYEFGVRHGRDVREVIDIFKPQKEEKTP